MLPTQLMDLKSANGTFLNGRPIPALSRIPLDSTQYLHAPIPMSIVTHRNDGHLLDSRQGQHPHR